MTGFLCLEDVLWKVLRMLDGVGARSPTRPGVRCNKAVLDDYGDGAHLDLHLEFSDPAAARAVMAAFHGRELPNASRLDSAQGHVNRAGSYDRSLADMAEWTLEAVREIVRHLKEQQQ